MIGEFKIIAGDCFLQTNKQGTLEKLPKLKLKWQLYFWFKQRIHGFVDRDEIRSKAFGGK